MQSVLASHERRRFEVTESRSRLVVQLRQENSVQSVGLSPRCAACCAFDSPSYACRVSPCFCTTPQRPSRAPEYAQTHTSNGPAPGRVSPQGGAAAGPAAAVAPRAASGRNSAAAGPSAAGGRPAAVARRNSSTFEVILKGACRGAGMLVPLMRKAWLQLRLRPAATRLPHLALAPLSPLPNLPRLRCTKRCSSAASTSA